MGDRKRGWETGDRRKEVGDRSQDLRDRRYSNLKNTNLKKVLENSKLTIHNERDSVMRFLPPKFFY